MREAFNIVGRVASNAVDTVKQADISNLFRPRMLVIFACVGLGACAQKAPYAELERAYDYAGVRHAEVKKPYELASLHSEKNFTMVSDLPLTVFEVKDDEVITLQMLAERFGQGEAFKKLVLDLNGGECCSDPLILPVPVLGEDVYTTSIDDDRSAKTKLKWGGRLLLAGLTNGMSEIYQGGITGGMWIGDKVVGEKTLDDDFRYHSSFIEGCIGKEDDKFIFNSMKLLKGQVKECMRMEKIWYADTFILKPPYSVNLAARSVNE